MIVSILLMSILAGLATLLGVWLVLTSRRFTEGKLIYLVSFSAGVLVSLAINHLLPEAVTVNKDAFAWLTVSFMAFYIIEHGLTLHACQGKEHCEVHETFTLVTWVGMMLHSLVDGFLIGISYEVSAKLGLLSALAVLLHRLPDGVSTVAVQLHGGRTVRQAVKSSVAVALATPVGAVVSLALIGRVNETTNGLLLALAAGSFLYVGASELIPEIHRHSKLANIGLTFLGALVPFAIEWMGR